jgi:hypothetical protein
MVGAAYGPIVFVPELSQLDWHWFGSVSFQYGDILSVLRSHYVLRGRRRAFSLEHGARRSGNDSANVAMSPLRPPVVPLGW